MSSDIHEDPRDGALMVLVPEGPFFMGLVETDFLAEKHETPRREIFLSAYWMDVHPVTNQRFAQFMEEAGYETQDWWSAEGWQWRIRHDIEKPAQWDEPGWSGNDQPVAGVSWFEADAYARWAKKHLPTDAQWEKAARGTDERRYPWGEDWPRSELANFDSRLGRTSPVGLYPSGASPYGCHDMAGNVNNWTLDWHWSEFGQWCVDQGKLTDPCLDNELRLQLSLFNLGEKVDRGGGFATAREQQEVLSCTRKTHWTPESRHPWNGFRTVKPYLPPLDPSQESDR